MPECDGKIGYATKKEAVTKRHHLWRTAKRRRLPTTEYECPHCGKWHLTSRPMKGKKR